MRISIRLVLILSFLLAYTFSYSQSKLSTSAVNVKWETNYSKAVRVAKKTKKPILIFFTGSDWCGPCKMLTKDFFETQKFNDVANKDLVLYEADFPRNKDLITDIQNKNNNKLKLKYQVNSFPTVIVVNNKGKIIGKRHSYNLMRDPSYYFKFLESIVN